MSIKTLIIIDKKPTKKMVKIEKEKSKRVITNTKQWTFLESDLCPIRQIEFIKQIDSIVTVGESTIIVGESTIIVGESTIVSEESTIIVDEPTITTNIKEDNSTDLIMQNKIKFIRQQIIQKIYGYKSQDLLKSKFDESKFVDFAKILEMMLGNNLKCYYCNQSVLVLYEYVREPRQWTVERINNKFGHNKDNIEIACLNCNLHRRTMYHERYLFTKNLNIVKCD